MTAITVIGICGFAAARGWSIVHFSLTTMDIVSSENREEAVRAWRTVPGVATAAWRAELTGKINPPDLKAANSRRDGLSAILSIRPLSSLDWLRLSGMQLATDQPIDTVLETLTLSVLTGPNEWNVMAERGIFGLSVWDALSPDLKDRAVTDLAAGTMASDRTRSELRAVLSTELETVRNELRKRLVIEGLSPKDLEQVGF